MEAGRSSIRCRAPAGGASSWGRVMPMLNNSVRSNPPFPDEGPAGAPVAYGLLDLGVLPDQAPLLPVALNEQGDLAAHGHAPPEEPDSWKVYGYVIKDGRRTQSLIPPGKAPKCAAAACCPGVKLGNRARNGAIFATNGPGIVALTISCASACRPTMA